MYLFDSTVKDSLNIAKMWKVHILPCSNIQTDINALTSSLISYAQKRENEKENKN